MNFRNIMIPLAFAGIAAATPAQSAVTLIATGTLDGTTDLSGLTGTLENGLAGNVLGGIGSGLAYAGGNYFYAIPDRGPNATPYNGAVDDTSSFISRFDTVRLTLTPSSSGLPFKLGTALVKTTLLSSPTALAYGTGAGLGNKYDGTPLGSGAPSVNTADTFYFTGRSDNYDPAKNSGNPQNARFDPEGVRTTSDLKSVFISDEYGPYVRQFDRQTGKLVKTFTLPDNLNVTTLSPHGQDEIDGNTVGRVANKGMEGLAITPDGKTLVGIMQAPLEQDAANADAKKLLRIVTIDIATGATKEIGYKLTTGSGVSEITAINNTQFLVDERDGKGLGDGSAAAVKQIFKIDISGAKDITGLTGKAAASAAVSKTLFLDAVQVLHDNGFAYTDIPAKLEGLTFGQDVTLNGKTLHTLYLANDNDFVPDVAGPNRYFVFGFSDSDLPGLVAQTFTASAAVPEPANWALLIAGFGLTGAALRRRQRAFA
jgi:hypothetical protein